MNLEPCYSMYGAYERAYHMWLSKIPPYKRKVFFRDGKISVGTASAHLSPAAGMLRKLKRINNL